MKANRTAVLLGTAATLALFGGAANAGKVTCPVIDFQVTTGDSFASPVCWDYGDENKDWPFTLAEFSGPGATPVLASLGGNKVLELPAGYVLWDKGTKDGGASGVPGVPAHAGSLTMSDGTFVITGASSLPFIFFVKQATEWAAFLLGEGVATGSIITFPGDGTDYSNIAVFGGDLRTVVPLPPAAWLLLSGLLGLGALSRWKASA